MLKNKLNWIDFKVEIKNTNFSPKLLKTKMDIFWKEVIETKLTANQHIWLLFRLQWTDNNFVTIGKLQKLNKEDKDYILNKLIDEIIDKGGYYLETSIISLVFTYAIRKGRALEKVINTNIHYHNYQHHKLPITMNPLEYGKLLDKIGNTYFIQVNPKNIAIINHYENSNEIKFFKSGELTYEYIDKWIDNETFSRILGKKEWIFRNNEQILFNFEKSVKFIQPLIRRDTLQNKIITMDIETFIKDGIHIPFIISWYDGENKFSYFLTDYNSSEDMIITCIKNIMIKKYDNYKIYIHNLAKFDGIFLLKLLSELGEIKPLIHNDKIISIGFKYKDYDVIFKDSLQLLIKSLKTLGLAFGVDIQKSIFPYDFVNENNLNYIGQIPDFKYFDGISSLDYNCYVENYNIWNLRDEAIKYCEIDCVSLYQIIIKFNELIFEHFSINIHKYPTLSSLAFAIFRSSFMENNLIPQLSGQIAKDIRQSYTGGAVDMYIPINDEETEIFGYDVNALYPFTMDKFDMPIGKPILFEGDIRKVDPKAFGFFYCNIKTPNILNEPIIQTHVKINNMTRTIAPIGIWEDMLFSEEMDNAKKYGYKFNILWGYTFEKSNIFKDYVEFLYSLRSKYSRSNPLNYIAKILLNSLYGRFGMDDNFVNIEVIQKDYYSDFENKYLDQIDEKIDLGDYMVVFYKTELINEDKESTHNVSIGIAAAITAYSRIHMSQFKNNPKINLYYTDTDSIYTDSDIDPTFISETVLGKLKLENICKKAIFLTPKVYCLETINGDIIHKVKGLSHDINLNLNDFESLLYKDSILQNLKTKWTKNLSEGHIKVLDQIYTLKVADNKRELVFDNNNKLINTKSIKIIK